MGAWSAGRVALRRRTLRFHLTVLYCALFLVTGAGLLAITYVLVDSTGTTLIRQDRDGTVIAANGSTAAHELSDGSSSARLVQLARQLNAQAAAEHARDLHELLTRSGLALAAMTVLAIMLAWLTLGRALHPLRAMKRATQQITEHNLDERLGISGPGDEVKDLADTIDGLLARLETAFEAQRRFVASASHELRTPLTLNRALLEVALADPDAGAIDLRATCEELLAAGEHQERLVEALLTLATSERGLDRRDPFDLAVTTRRALALHYSEAEHRHLSLTVSLGRAAVRGDPDLAERMAANLINNAIRYNLPDNAPDKLPDNAPDNVPGHPPGGRVEVRTETRYDHAVLIVTNTGPPVPADQVDQLFQPFQRLTADRTGHPDGHGLGLSIVRAIATAHEARLEVTPGPDGGLTVEAHFPPAASPANRRPACPNLVDGPLYQQEQVRRPTYQVRSAQDQRARSARKIRAASRLPAGPAPRRWARTCSRSRSRAPRTSPPTAS